MSIVTVMRLDSQPFHHVYEIALKVLTMTRETKLLGRLFMAEVDTHLWSEWKLFCSLELLVGFTKPYDRYVVAIYTFLIWSKVKQMAVS